MEVDISCNFLLIVTQPGEGPCSVAAQSNSPGHNKSIDQSVSKSVNQSVNQGSKQAGRQSYFLS
jgi:hypothetical protein